MQAILKKRLAVSAYYPYRKFAKFCHIALLNPKTFVLFFRILLQLEFDGRNWSQGVKLCAIPYIQPVSRHRCHRFT